MNTHLSFGAIGWTEGKNQGGVETALADLGVRHIRDGVSFYYNQVDDQTILSSMYTQHGIRLDAVMSINYGFHADVIPAWKRTYPGLEAIEGGNESDSPYTKAPFCSAPDQAHSCWPQEVTQQAAFYAPIAKANGLSFFGSSVEFGANYDCSPELTSAVPLTLAQCPNDGTPNLSALPDQGSVISNGNMHAYPGG